MNGKETAHESRIGILNETSVHAFLKAYMDPDTAHHEVRCGRHIADVANDGGICEIQTRGFYRIRGKLEEFLRDCPVTLVYPVTARKTLYWIDPETGECTAGRKTGRHCTVCEIWKELPEIADLMENPRFEIRIVLLETEEYRALDGYGSRKKYRASHIDRCPLKILEEVRLSSPKDFGRLIPSELFRKTEPFTSLEFAKAGHIPRRAAQAALRILNESGFVSRLSLDSAGYHYCLSDSAQWF